MGLNAFVKVSHFEDVEIMTEKYVVVEPVFQTAVPPVNESLAAMGHPDDSEASSSPPQTLASPFLSAHSPQHSPKQR